MNKSVLLFLVVIASIFFNHPIDLLVGIRSQDSFFDVFWADRWFYAMLAMIVYVGLKIKQSHHMSVALLIGYSLISSLYAFGWHGSYPYIKTDIQAFTAYSFSAIMLGLFCLGSFSYKDLPKVQKAFSAICFINIIMVIFQFLLGVPNGSRAGIFGNPSMSGCFISITLPFVVMMGHSFIALLGLVAIGLIGSSQPIGIIAVAAAAYYLKVFSKSKFVTKILVTSLTLGSILILIPITTSKHHRSAFDNSGRFEVWKTVLGPWFKDGRYIVGQGTGTTEVIVPRIQAIEESKKHKNKTESFHLTEYKWFHSEYLQMLFENGIIGLLLMLNVIYYSLIISYKKNAFIFSTLCAYLATMMFNFPFHLPMHAIFGGILLSMIFKKESFCEQA